MATDFPPLVAEVVTYQGNRIAAAERRGEKSDQSEDFGPPLVPVSVHPYDGLRVVLGAHDKEDYSKPDIQIERRPNGWAIFLHPVGGSDSAGVVYFHDDGRSFIDLSRGPSPTPQLEIVSDVPPEIDT